MIFGGLPNFAGALQAKAAYEAQERHAQHCVRQHAKTYWRAFYGKDFVGLDRDNNPISWRESPIPKVDARNTLTRG